MGSNAATTPPHVPDAGLTSLDVVRDVLAPGAGRTERLIGVGRPSPRFLLPDARVAAAAACTEYNALRRRRTRVTRSLTALAVKAGVGGMLGPSVELTGTSARSGGANGSLVEHLSRQLGEPLTAAVGLGNLDAYWTPVLQLFSAAGRPVGYAKIGWNPVTRAFVEREWVASVCLGEGDGGLVTPAPLYRGTWGDLEISTLAPMPRSVARLGDDTVPEVPARLATLDGPTRDVALADSDWWARARSAVEAAIGLDGTPSLHGICDDVVDQLGDQPITFGRIHGDWVPWNLAHADGELVAWDWEYSEPDGPLGIDEVHGRYQVARLLNGMNDIDAFAASEPIGPAALLHPLMVLSRRCWTSAMNRRVDGMTEMTAAAQVLRSRVDAQAGVGR